jgi:hypothetical protein
MAKNRCFNTSNNTIQTASDYSIALKQKTLYSNVAQNMNLVGNANPLKKDGIYYNNNFGVVPLTSNTSAGCLINSQSYDLLLNVTKGQSLYNAANDNINGFASVDTPLNSNEAWAGNLFSINYSTNGINVVVDTSYNAGNKNKIIYPQTISAYDADLSFNTSYPGVIVDPSYLLFYDPCLINPWLPLVDVGFNNTNYYQAAVKNNPFSNFSYPQKVIFACSPKQEFNLDCSQYISDACSNQVTAGQYGNAMSLAVAYCSINFIPINSGFLNRVDLLIQQKTVSYWNISINDTDDTLNTLYSQNFLIPLIDSSQNPFPFSFTTPVEVLSGNNYYIIISSITNTNDSLVYCDQGGPGYGPANGRLGSGQNYYYFATFLCG